MVQILIDAGADVNFQRATGHNTALHVASIAGYEGVVRVLIDAGANTNLLGEKYNSAMEMASRNGHEEVVQMLKSKLM